MSKSDIEILQLVKEKFDDQGDDHLMTNIDTPIRDDAFKLNDEEKIDKIKEYFEKIMITLGLDLNDDSLKGTPYRVAKMYVKEMCSGLNPQSLNSSPSSYDPFALSSHFSISFHFPLLSESTYSSSPSS